ncbi:hypothetical protein K435DRAFT_856582 [Dendrothele bispora CBS 962.96]|uniref:Uncharacterized protein n=1 Tax=Dendrothele bispora (strain CBS 962.96) TaxID=1314807 RepID=A0A4V4HGD9_DENBC|nr:hypothetical protein K435DRAFT_856582 [Dendrothele bispora CBS 962.96]
MKVTGVPKWFHLSQVTPPAELNEMLQYLSSYGGPRAAKEYARNLGGEYPFSLTGTIGSELESDKRPSTANRITSYLEAYRGGQVGIPSPSAFKDSVESDFIKVSQDYEEDLATWRDYQERLRAAEQHSFPGVSVSQLTSKMNRADKAVIAVILVPEQVKFVDLLNTYRVLAADICQWRTSIDEPKKKEGSNDPEDKPAPTEYMSLYADALRDAPLLRLDDSTNSLKTALETVRKTSNVAFLTYGIGVNAMGGLTWEVLNPGLGYYPPQS